MTGRPLCSLRTPKGAGARGVVRPPDAVEKERLSFAAEAMTSPYAEPCDLACAYDEAIAAGDYATALAVWDSVGGLHPRDSQ